LGNPVSDASKESDKGTSAKDDASGAKGGADTGAGKSTIGPSATGTGK